MPVHEQVGGLENPYSPMEPHCLGLIVDISASLGKCCMSMQNAEQQYISKDMRMQCTVNWQAKVRNGTFVVDQTDLERPGLSVGLRQVQINSRQAERCDSCKVCSLDP